MDGMTQGFDRVAGVYRWLEYAAFGKALERARVAFVDRLSHCENILILGDGDGRFLKTLVPAAPAARIRSVDASARMLLVAAQPLRAADRARVTFEQADALDLDLGTSTYDAVVTLFFLDCFSHDQVDALVSRVSRHMRPDALWLFADFAIPPRGLARWSARVVVGGLYWFFRWQTGLVARELPASERSLKRAGWWCVDEVESHGGLVRSTAYLMPPHGPG